VNCKDDGDGKIFKAYKEGKRSVKTFKPSYLLAPSWILKITASEEKLWTNVPVLSRYSPSLSYPSCPHCYLTLPPCGALLPQRYTCLLPFLFFIYLPAILQAYVLLKLYLLYKFMFSFSSFLYSWWCTSSAKYNVFFKYKFVKPPTDNLLRNFMRVLKGVLLFSISQNEVAKAFRKVSIY
jgi:hypothetical protein